MQRQVELTRNQLRDLRMSHESNQAKLLDHSQRQGTANRYSNAPSLTLHLVLVDQESIAKLAEMDMLVSDLERANSRVATVERRNVCLICLLYLASAIVIRNFCVQKLKQYAVGTKHPIGAYAVVSPHIALGNIDNYIQA